MLTILMTGQLVSNSIQALVYPIATCKYVRKIIFVVDVPGPPLPNVTYRTPPKWLRKIFGRAFSKLMLLIYLGLKMRPDYVHSFSVFPHAISAFLTAKLIRAKNGVSIIGGKVNVEGGGYKGDNWFLSLGGKKKPWMEKLFFTIFRRSTLVTVMGRNTQKYLNAQGINHVFVLPMFINMDIYQPGEGTRDIDLISASSLIQRKRIDIFIEAIHQTNDSHLKGVILGRGELEDELKQLTKRLNLDKQIIFMDFVEKFEAHLQRSKLFVMASNSEGLSIAMLMGMACGAVPIVRDVGDLCQAVHHRKNGLLIDSDDPEQFAAAIQSLLNDEQTWAQMSQTAVDTIKQHYSKEAGNRGWEKLLEMVFSRTYFESRPGQQTV